MMQNDTMEKDVMNTLANTAGKQSDQYEIYQKTTETDTVEFRAGGFSTIAGTITAGTGLRLIKDKKLGFAYTRNLNGPRELVDNALESLAAEVEACYTFPVTKDPPELDNKPDPSVTALSNREFVKECKKIRDFFADKSDAEIGIYAGRSLDKVMLKNSSGTELSHESGTYHLYVNLVYPGGAVGVARIHTGKAWAPVDTPRLQRLLELYKAGNTEIDPKSGKMDVLFMPGSLHTFLWRLQTGLSGKSLYNKISPLGDKQGEQILSPLLTMYDDPLNDTLPGAAAFDEEGTAKQTFSFFKKGVLENFYYDLDYAAKLKTRPTGHGHRTGRWGADPVTTLPTPWSAHWRIQRGDKSLDEMISMMDRGIILEGVMGAHSGNIPNGDYSVGVAPAFYVENGTIKGRIKDAMVAGNVYETLQLVEAVQDQWEPGYDLPALLCRDVAVATKE